MYEKFNEAQREAIRHNRGPALILAGPGSGKTLVITHRIRNLIEEYGANPSEILVITFTKAAANEMQERYWKLNSGKKDSVTFGTFHAVFYHIIQNTYHYSSGNILREETKIQYIKEIIENMKLETEDDDLAEDIATQISRLKNHRIDIMTYESDFMEAEQFRYLYEAYNKKRRENRQLDFDDMLTICLELLEKREEVLKEWQDRYRYILIDEFQDINTVQYDIIRLLARPQYNLFVVGDDDQSIYGFRGARPEIMQQFENDFTGTRTILLNINYRSSSEIIKFADQLIRVNQNRFKKEIIAEAGDIRSVSVRELDTLKEETEEIIKCIKEQAESTSYKDITILIRTHSMKDRLVEKLSEENIPYRTKHTTPHLYSHFIAKDFFAYLALGQGSRERRDLFQILNKPSRYISRSFFEGELVDLEALARPGIVSADVAGEIRKLGQHIQRLEKMSPFGALNYIWKGIGYEQFLIQYARRKGIAYEKLEVKVNEMKERSREYVKTKHWLDAVEKWKAGEITSAEQTEKKSSTPAVSIMTMHQAKGLEFKTVIIPDVNETILPYKKAQKKEEVEEERRLMYVAVTRAKENLFLYYVKERSGRKAEKSRFLQEIEKGAQSELH